MSQNKEADDSKIVQLLTEVQLPLLLYVRSLLPGDPSAQDVAQQTSATVWRKRADYTPGTNFKAWVFSIARFEVLNHRKGMARETRLQFQSDLEDIVGTELSQAGDRMAERHEALRICLGKLRSQDRDLLLYRYSSRGTLADFADTVGRSVNSLKVTLYRLRNNLADCISRQIVPPETNA